MIITKNFTIPVQSTISKEYTNNSDDLIITGIANTGLEDLVGDVVTQEALQSIAEQIPTHNLHLDHDKDINGILGPLLEGWIDDNGYLNYKARIIKERSDLIKSYLEQGVNFGSSISGVCEYEEGSYNTITKWGLTEISLTGIPCDQGTMASVSIAKSFVDAVQNIKNIRNGGDIMADEITEEKITEMINTAINEIKEDLTQTIIEQVNRDNENIINELKAEIDEIKAKLEEQTAEPAEDTSGEEDVTVEVETPATSPDATSEGKAETEDDEDKPEDEEEDEEDKKVIIDTIKTMVHAELKKVFNTPQNPKFNYDNQEKGTQKNETTNKKYTVDEIAEKLMGN